VPHFEITWKRLFFQFFREFRSSPSK
jgi:hypothetical protein